jgi:hypothetical protein
LALTSHTHLSPRFHIDFSQAIIDIVQLPDPGECLVFKRMRRDCARFVELPPSMRPATQIQESAAEDMGKFES